MADGVDKGSAAMRGSLAWIPVTERVPAVNENVLWLVDEYGGFNHVIGCMGAGEKIFSDEGIQYWVTRNTYWMPLPAPPPDAKWPANTQDQEHRMSDSTTPQDSAAMSPASAGSVAGIIDRLCAAVQEDEPPRRALLASAAVEIERLRFAIRRLADQDATLSVCDGDVTVTVDGTLTDAERDDIACAASRLESDANGPRDLQVADTLREVLERLGGKRG